MHSEIVAAVLLGALWPPMVVVLAWGASAILRAWAEGGLRRWAVEMAIVVLALLLRLAAPAWPQDIHDRLNPPLDMTYGAGFQVWGLLLHPEGWTGRAWNLSFAFSRERVFHAAAVAGALTLPAVGVLVRWLGGSLGAARWAMFALAVEPTLVRFGHSDNQMIPALLLWGIGLVALLQHVAAPSGMEAVVAGLAMGLVVHMRPDSLLLLPCALVVAHLGPVPVPWSDRRTVWGLALAIAVGALHAPILTRDFGGGQALFGLMEDGVRHFVWLDPATSSWATWALLGAGLAIGRVPLRARAWLLVWALALSLHGARWSRSSIPATARHQVIALPAVGALIGLGAGALPPTRWGALAGLALGAGLAAPVRAAWAPAAEEVDYRAWVEGLRLLPAGCVAVAYRPRIDTTIDAFRSTPAELGLQVRTIDLGDPLPDSGCVAWFRGATCYWRSPEDPDLPPGPDGRAALAAPCREFEAGVVLREQWTRTLPRRVTGFGLFYAGRPEVGWFLLER